MNITDVESQEIQGDRLSAIFSRQLELVEKYQEIEGMPEFPFSPHSRIGQKFFKDFAWRMTEELIEAMEAFEAATYENDDSELKDKHLMHAEEEIVDALHFLVENLILVGIEPKELVDSATHESYGGSDRLETAYLVNGFLIAENNMNGDRERSIADLVMMPIYRTGLAMNCLKNKPWKQTEILTDVPRFRGYMIEAFHGFIQMCIWMGVDDQKLTDLYFKKAAVNSFRQRSKY